MYGVVNRALEDHIVSKYGADKWQEVSGRADLDIDVFISNEAYSDDITYKLVGSACQTLDVCPRDLLKGFGEHWVLKTGAEYYGAMLRSGGSSLKEFLINLPQFHARVQLIYPKLQPPEFSCSDIRENSLRLHYFTHRAGLTDFVVGLLYGLGKLFETPTMVELVESKAAGADHDVFEVTWGLPPGVERNAG